MLKVTVTVPFHASDTDFAARLGLFPGRGTEGAVPRVDGDSRPSSRDSARSAGHDRCHALPQVLHQAPLRRRRSAPGSLSTRVSVSPSLCPICPPQQRTSGLLLWARRVQEMLIDCYTWPQHGAQQQMRAVPRLQLT